MASCGVLEAFSFWVTSIKPLSFFQRTCPQSATRDNTHCFAAALYFSLITVTVTMQWYQTVAHWAGSMTIHWSSFPCILSSLCNDIKCQSHSIHQLPTPQTSIHGLRSSSASHYLLLENPVISWLPHHPDFYLIIERQRRAQRNSDAEARLRRFKQPLRS